MLDNGLFIEHPATPLWALNQLLIQALLFPFHLFFQQGIEILLLFDGSLHFFIKIGLFLRFNGAWLWFQGGRLFNLHVGFFDRLFFDWWFIFVVFFLQKLQTLLSFVNFASSHVFFNDIIFFLGNWLFWKSFAGCGLGEGVEIGVFVGGLGGSDF